MSYLERYESILPYFMALKLYENPYQNNIIFKPNVLYTYIPSYILDPLPKDLTFIKSYLLDRYRDEEVDKDLITRYNNIKDKYQYTLAYDLLPDDVILLGYEEKSDYYWYFWFDKDCSDCACGRFQTQDTREKVIKIFDQKTQELQKNYCDTYHAQRIGKLIELKKFHCSKGF